MCVRLPHVSAEGISTSPSEAGDGPQTAAVAIRCRWGFLRGTFFSFFETVLVPRARGAGMEGQCWKRTFTPHECSGFQCGREAPARLHSPQTFSTQSPRDPYLLSVGQDGWCPHLISIRVGLLLHKAVISSFFFFFFLLVFLAQVAFSPSPKLPPYCRPNPCSAPGSWLWKCCDRFSSLVSYSV